MYRINVLTEGKSEAVATGYRYCLMQDTAIFLTLAVRLRLSVSFTFTVIFLLGQLTLAKSLMIGLLIIVAKTLDN